MAVQGEASPSPRSQLGSLGTASERFIEGKVGNGNCVSPRDGSSHLRAPWCCLLPSPDWKIEVCRCCEKHLWSVTSQDLLH